MARAFISQPAGDSCQLLLACCPWCSSCMCSCGVSRSPSGTCCARAIHVVHVRPPDPRTVQKIVLATACCGAGAHNAPQVHQARCSSRCAAQRYGADPALLRPARSSCPRLPSSCSPAWCTCWTAWTCWPSTCRARTWHGCTCASSSCSQTVGACLGTRLRTSRCAHSRGR